MSLVEYLAAGIHNKVAINNAGNTYTYAQLVEHVELLASWIQKRNITSLCINLSNSYEWIVVDLACQAANIVCTPIPQFFSAPQVAHLLEQTTPDVVIGAPLRRYLHVEVVAVLTINAYFCETLLHTASKAVLPNNTTKITFTSGSTGQAKGVCLSTDNQLVVAKSLVDAIGVSEPRHLVILPLPTLLENIAGVYAPLLAMGEVLIPTDTEKGFEGSRLVNLAALLSCISHHQPHTMIVVPELLFALIMSIKNGWKAPNSLRFIAVGGAKVDVAMIKQAHALGLPVFQGYGLSECASVVSLCTSKSPQESVGKVLAHLSVRTNNGELEVSGNAFLGYLNQPESWHPEWVSTGDLVTIENQHLYITGRKKNLIINSFGRNISPEWIESKLMATGLFAQTMLVGDTKPFLCALLVPISELLNSQQIANHIDVLNEHLPDYAHIIKFIVLEQSFTHANGLLTENGKLKRDAIVTHYTTLINQQYL